MFLGYTLTREDRRDAYGELRLQTIGLLGDLVVVLIVHTPRNGDDHIISIRKAKKNEESTYWKSFPG